MSETRCGHRRHWMQATGAPFVRMGEVSSYPDAEVAEPCPAPRGALIAELREQASYLSAHQGTLRDLLSRTADALEATP